MNLYETTNVNWDMFANFNRRPTCRNSNLRTLVLPNYMSLISIQCQQIKRIELERNSLPLPTELPKRYQFILSTYLGEHKIYNFGRGLPENSSLLIVYICVKLEWLHDWCGNCGSRRFYKILPLFLLNGVRFRL